MTSEEFLERLEALPPRGRWFFRFMSMEPIPPLEADITIEECTEIAGRMLAEGRWGQAVWCLVFAEAVMALV
jgi:hypothetical protein